MSTNKFVLFYIGSIFVVLFFCGGLVHAEPTYTNPVIPAVGPADPTIILHDGIYYMYPTGDNVRFNAYTSYDLVHWNFAGEVFQPPYGVAWAPDVFYHQADGKFYMWYTSDWHIGLAIADNPLGPFIDQGIRLTGYIDAHVFQDDDGRCYLYYTDLGHIYVHPMDGPAFLTGTPRVILEPSQDWEMRTGRVNEGPWMMKHNGLYYLLYSGSAADSADYAIGYATATSPMGPFTKYPGNPIIHGGGGVHGPGHGAVTRDAAGNMWHIYHQKVNPELSYERFVCIDPMWFDRNGVLHSRATRGIELPAPANEVDPKISAYWRFEGGPAGAQVPNPNPGGIFHLSVTDSSGNGNELSVWDQGNGGYVFRPQVPSSLVTQTEAANHFSVKNSGSFPGMWTSPYDLVSRISPAAFTVEATFKLENGGFRTLIGRDSWGSNTAGDNPNADFAALYLQADPDNRLAIKFCDVAGYWHDATSEVNVFESFDFGADPDGNGVPWYSVAAVSDGSTLSLYLLDHNHSESGYQLIAQTDMTAVNPSPNTALTAGGGDGPDWNAGSWTVGRGLYAGGHGDRAWGYLDEVRISRVALNETEFLFSDPNIDTVAYWRFEEGTIGTRVPHGGLPNGEYYPSVLDMSGNGNHLSVWSETLGAYLYRNDVPLETVPQTQASNQVSVMNVDGLPGMFTSSDDAQPTGVAIDDWQPLDFTIEASFKPQDGGHRTIVGRDGLGVTYADYKLASLYLQLQPDDSVAIKFADVSGFWHEAVSEPGVIEYDNGGHWYHAAAVCDGKELRLYLNNTDAKAGYQLVAQTDIAASGSPDLRLSSDWTVFIGSDWHGGGWTVGRGLFDGGHEDRFFGHIDEVRISANALEPEEFLFYSGIDVSPENILVYEDGTTSSDMYFALTSKPSNDVVVTVSEQNGRGQLTLSPSYMTFKPSNWSTPQSIRIAAVDDLDLENAMHTVPLAITFFSSDPQYDELIIDPVMVTVADNECGAWGYASGDFNRDCVVDINDLAEMAQYWLTCSEQGQSGCSDFSSN
ncbi:Arabinoxylan arabinofuranohydrolase precursor [Anaerohalosphaera lusitana]|uniref:Arabinoxylan arabinofuranohydrolase n=1 Tax=Anaerohalosphaera lusitana TaxID=1936003 RepID=A0A1U9NMH0_9BACT|nr:family 43 glycosylhydrolase [Anaerohalosphaera lusitana]AQT69109.1 Arabinoxylan arabinofuranohydrolase precursor [Anaerohalosphaera lusitana]